MQFGVFTVGDVTPDPTTGQTVSEEERIRIMVDRRPQGGRGRPRRLRDRRAPQRAVRPLLPDHAARLHRREDEAPPALDRDDADHDQRPGQDRRGLRDAPAPGRRPGRPDDGPREHGPGLPVVRAGPAQRDPACRRELRPPATPVARGRRRLGGPVPDAADRGSRPRRGRSMACRRSSGTARSAAPRSPSRPRTTATASSTTTSSGRAATCSGWSSSTAAASSTTATGRRTRPSSGLGGHVFMRKNSQDAIREFRPYFDHAPVYGGAMSLEDYMAQTPMTIGSPQQVIDRTLGFREFAGDYQRQLFIADHGGLPLKTVLEQMDILGSEVVPVLRREFEALRPAGRAGRAAAPSAGRGRPARRRPRRRQRQRSWRRRRHERHRRPARSWS